MPEDEAKLTGKQPANKSGNKLALPGSLAKACFLSFLFSFPLPLSFVFSFLSHWAVFARLPARRRRPRCGGSPTARPWRAKDRSRATCPTQRCTCCCFALPTVSESRTNGCLEATSLILSSTCCASKRNFWLCCLFVCFFFSLLDFLGNACRFARL